jgi:glutathione S-transferase
MQNIRKHNRIGKIPLLILEDGTAIPESQVIVEYLEERFGTKSGGLLPCNHAPRSRARLVARIHDVYMGSHFLPTLFRDLSPEQTAIGLKWIETALDMLEELHPSGEQFFVGGQASVADISLAPTIVYMLVRGEKLKGGSPFTGRPHLRAWWARMMRDATWQRIYTEMETVFPANNPLGHMFSGRV